MKKLPPRRAPKLLVGAFGLLLLAALLDRAYDAYQRHQAPLDSIQVSACGNGPIRANGVEMAAFDEWRKPFGELPWQAWIVRGMNGEAAADEAYFAVGDSQRIRIFRAKLNPPARPRLVVNWVHAAATGQGPQVRLQWLRFKQAKQWLLIREGGEGAETLHLFDMGPGGLVEYLRLPAWDAQAPGVVVRRLLYALNDHELRLLTLTRSEAEAPGNEALEESVYVLEPGSFSLRHHHPLPRKLFEPLLLKLDPCQSVESRQP